MRFGAPVIDRLRYSLRARCQRSSMNAIRPPAARPQVQPTTPAAAPVAPPPAAPAPRASPHTSGVEAQPAGRLIPVVRRTDSAPVASRLGAADLQSTRGSIAMSRVMADVRSGQMQAASPGVAEMQYNRTIQGNVRGALGRGDVRAAGEELKGQTNDEMLATLQQLDRTQFGKLVEGVRSGAITDDKVAMAINVETLGRTQWARTHGDEVDNLRERFARGKVSYSDNPDGKTETTGDLAYTDTKGSVTLHRDMMAHPEIAAAALANESVHSHGAVEGAQSGSSTVQYLEEETASSVADAAVWKELRGNSPDRNHPLAADSEALVKVHQQGGVDGMRAHVAASYASSLAAAGQYQSPRDILVQLADQKSTQQVLTAEQAEQLAGAAATMWPDANANGQGNVQIQDLAKAVRHASPEARAAAEARIRRDLGDQRADFFAFAVTEYLKRD